MDAFSSKDLVTWGGIGVAVSDNPGGPYRDPPGTDRWYIVYHRRPLDRPGRNARVVCIDLMEFDSEGNILPVKITSEGVKEQKLR